MLTHPYPPSPTIPLPLSHPSYIDDHSVEGQDQEGKAEGEEIDELKIRAKRGEGPKQQRVLNIFRKFFAAKARKVHSNKEGAEFVYAFCHEHWKGGRVDTGQLSRHPPVIVPQPDGSVTYEPVRTFQYTPREMWLAFCPSEYGMAHKNKYGKHPGRKLFEKLICPCLTKAKQIDTADEITQDMAMALQCWDNMRKKNVLVKRMIAECRKGGKCACHKEGSAYMLASTSKSAFLDCILCAPVEWSELAVQPAPEGGHDARAAFHTATSAIQAKNLAAAAAAQSAKHEEFLSSGAAAAPRRKITKLRQQQHEARRSDDLVGFSFFQRNCSEGHCDKCGLDRLEELPVMIPPCDTCEKTVHTAVSATYDLWDNLSSEENSNDVEDVEGDIDRFAEMLVHGLQEGLIEDVISYGCASTAAQCVDAAGDDDMPEILKSPDAIIDSALESFRSRCSREFNPVDQQGRPIAVSVVCKTYKDQLRSGSFQKEMEEVVMLLSEFFDHLIRCAKRYMKHHFADVISSQVRRNHYEKMKTDRNLATVATLASDYSAIYDGHSQCQLNQTIQMHAAQLVILASWADWSVFDDRAVVRTEAYSFWFQAQMSKLKTDNHVYRECVKHVLNDLRSKKGVIFDRVITITDGASTQFKNRYNMAFLCALVALFGLLWVMAMWPPTATFKGEHDKVGGLGKDCLQAAEKSARTAPDAADVDTSVPRDAASRFPTTRSCMPTLWNMIPLSPRALKDPNRKTHEIDEHVHIHVVDEPFVIPSDRTDSRVLITNKSEQDTDSTLVKGTFSCYMAIAFPQPQAPIAQPDARPPLTRNIYLRAHPCSCDTCHAVKSLDDFEKVQHNCCFSNIL